MMTGKLAVILFLGCAVSCAQSTLTIPTDPTQPSPLVPGEDTATQLNLAMPHGDNQSLEQPPAPAPFKTKSVGRTQRTVSASTEMEMDGDAAPQQFFKAPQAVTLRTDFEIFAEQEAGHPLAVYGRHFFDEAPDTFAPLERIPVPADYTLGPGDELLIRAWGKIDLDSHVIVDRNGQISLPRVGILRVAGLRYEQLEGYLRGAIGNLYKAFELNVTLGKLRSVQIFVLGNARQPGVYTVSSLSTLADAIFACGGPSGIGSMRRIQLRRGDHTIGEYDMYRMIRQGDKSTDVPLLSGDVIYIPPVGPQVALIENVNEPGIYELNADTTIEAALANAGGLTSLARVDRILLERIENHSEHRVEEFALDAAGLKRTLKDGDLVRIRSLSPRFENTVTLRGNIAQPGRYAWHDGMRVSDLIPSRGFLLTREHWNNENRLVSEISDHVPELSRGAAPDRSNLMSDISEASAEINWDYAVIERTDDHDLSTRLVAFNLGTAIDSPASSENAYLEAGDTLTVFSRKDLPLPMDKHARFILLGGEVGVPGVYRLNPGETLRDVVRRAGGLTAHSYLFASQLTRASTRKIQEEELSLSEVRMKKDLYAQYAQARHATGNQNTNQSAAGQTAASPQTQLASQESLIGELFKVKPAGRVVLGILPGASDLADLPAFPLEDGDSFYIPPKLGTVQVSGEVYNTNAFRYQDDRTLEQYLRDSGGPTRIADVKRVFLIRADGTVVSRQSGSRWGGNFGKMSLMPGDTIIVPPKLKAPGGLMDTLPLITQVISQTAMTGAVLSLLP